MARQRTVTREQAETKKEQAAALMQRIGEPDRADEYRDMSVEEYAQGQGLSLTNPRRGGIMSETKSELNDKLDDISDLIDAALDAGLTREEVVAKVKEMRDVVESEEEDEDDVDADEDLDECDEDDTDGD
jgi:hypothetical protein